MLKAIIKLLVNFLGFTLIGVFGKLIFLAFNHGIYSGIGCGDILHVIANGFTMDMSMAGYFSVLPALLLCVALAIGSKGIIDRLLNIYFLVISLIVSLVTIADAALYSYWQFKLDSTPLFYFFSSPKSALASIEWWQFILFPCVWLVWAFVCYLFLHYMVVVKTGDILPSKGKTAVRNISVMVVVTALLFIPIRGGVTVSTMNLSRAYFSEDPKLNHAAVNPEFSLLYSLTHQDNFNKQYRFFEETENDRLFTALTHDLNLTQTGIASDSLSANDTVPLLSSDSPDIYIILLESFSSHLFPSLGGEPVALKLDSIARSGLLFKNFYANSFRTDRGIPSVLSAYPGQPSTSIMKFVDKTEKLPSLSKELKDRKGYSNEYYYGGDANFTNMKAYLVSAGFDKIISDRDFPINQKMSKWGAHDHVLFSRITEELKPYDRKHPVLRVIQTSSSHEPFDVPYDDKGRFADKRARAFAYTDSCTSAFIEHLRELPQWNQSLVVIVPDHYGAYPDLSDPIDRHKIPLIMTGGALQKKGHVETTASQIDIAATILSAIGIKDTPLRFSKDIFDENTPHFAFFADPSVIGLITETDSVVFNLESSDIEKGDKALLPYAQSFLQTLYNDLSER